MSDSLSDHDYVEDDYSFRNRVGSYGCFKTKDSFPLEYVQIGMRHEDLRFLTLAKDLKATAERNFAMLLQRDIDEEKIEKALNYLTKENATSDKSVFFPPLLAAIVPVHNNEMALYYNDETFQSGEVGGVKNRLVRSWKDHFKVAYVLGNGAESNQVSATKSETGECKVFSVKPTAVTLDCRVVEEHGKGVRLVVIDGQHRLETLRRLLATDPGLLNDLVIPVCLVFPPNATNYYQNRAANTGHKIPTVVETFRKLFLDVNSRMTSVSGHFRSLLNDTSADGLAVRAFCDSVVANRGHRALATIEWNIRNDKESKEISRPYSMTSIGVIAPMLRNLFDRNGYYLLNLVDIHAKLKEGGGDLNLENLSYFQKTLIESQIAKEFLPVLDAIFFEAAEFKRIQAEFEKAVDSLEGDREKALSGDKWAYSAVLDNVLAYKYLAPGKGSKEDLVAKIKNSFVDAIALAYSLPAVPSKYDAQQPIALKAIFQKGMFDALAALTSKVEELNCSTKVLSAAFVGMLDEALKNQSELFRVEQPFLQYVLFDKTTIRTDKNAQKSVCNLLLAILGRMPVAEHIATKLEIADDDEARAVAKSLVKLGQNHAKYLLEQFEAARKKAFVKGYRLDPNIVNKQELEALERKKNEDTLKAKQKLLAQSAIDKGFDQKVAELVKKEVELARISLQDALNYSEDIVTDENDSDSNGED